MSERPDTPGGEDPWDAARATSREQVQAALARRETERVCPHCGRESRTSAAQCPHCGGSYAARRARGLSPRARRVVWTAGIAVALAAAVAAAVVVPRIDDSKRSTAQREARQLAVEAASQRRALEREQRPHRAAGAAAPAGGRAARLALVDRLEAEITRDARARARAGTLDGPVRRTLCEPYPVNVGLPRVPATGRIGRYQCYAVLIDVRRGGERRVAGFIGQPFWARADFATGKLVWCRISPPPGERGQQALGTQVLLPSACDVRR